MIVWFITYLRMQFGRIQVLVSVTTGSLGPPGLSVEVLQFGKLTDRVAVCDRSLDRSTLSPGSPRCPSALHKNDVQVQDTGDQLRLSTCSMSRRTCSHSIFPASPITVLGPIFGQFAPSTLFTPLLLPRVPRGNDPDSPVDLFFLVLGFAESFDTVFRLFSLLGGGGKGDELATAGVVVCRRERFVDPVVLTA
jgi:hypothetical protein